MCFGDWLEVDGVVMVGGIVLEFVEYEFVLEIIGCLVGEVFVIVLFGGFVLLDIDMMLELEVEGVVCDVICVV